MPFLRAGFNPRNRGTGIRAWTRNVHDPKIKFALAELRVHACGDMFWRGVAVNFWEWGEQCVIGTWGFSLCWEFQNGLAHSDVETRKESPAWEWVEKRRASICAGLDPDEADR